MARAVRLCPSLVIVPAGFRAVPGGVERRLRDLPRGHAARRAAVARRGVSRRHRERLGRAAGDDASRRRLKARIRETTGLTASAGVAPNKFLAKIASGWKKPDGLTVISPERVEPFLQQLPVDALWGVGPVTARKLRARGIERLVDVRTADSGVLREAVGSLADWLRQLAAGVDDRPVVPNRDVEVVGLARTPIPEDLTDLDRDSRGDRRDGGARRRLARAEGRCSRAR